MSRWIVWLLLVFLIGGCNDSAIDKGEGSNNGKDDSGDIVPDSEGSIFEELPASMTGLDFSNQLTPTTELNILEYLYYYNGGGVAVGDFDQDGLEDVYLTANQSADKLFLNQSELKFKDATTSVGVDGFSGWSSGVTTDDVDGDGDLDIYVCKVAPISKSGTHNLLFINNGSGQFTESSKNMGLDFAGYSTQAAFFDYDRDGDLDMYLLNHSVHSVRSYGKISKRQENDAFAGDRIYENKLNESEGKFVDVTEQSGIYSSALGYGLAVMAEDVNDDGWIDIYVGNDFHENDYLYINNGDKTFTESIKLWTSHTTKFTMGVDMMDMNQDGRIDIFTTDMLPDNSAVALKSGGEDTEQIFSIRKEFGFEDQYARNHFQLQNAQGYFTDVALMTNTFATDWSWSVLLNDFDNNGLNDIFITNGIVKRPNDLDYINFINTMAEALRDSVSQSELDLILNIMPSEKLSNLLFQQSAPLTFSPVQKSKVGEPGFSNGAAYADFDLDGDLDIIVNNLNGHASVLKNTTDQSKNYIAFSFAKEEAQCKHAEVRVMSGGQWQTKKYITTRGYQSSVSHHIQFGLGGQSIVDSVIVNWPDRQQSVFHDLAINQLHYLRREGLLPHQMNTKKGSEFVLEKFDFKHIENDFADYNYDKLIPELLSREGPAVVYEDFSGDGLKDIFIGGGRFQPAGLFFGKEDGTFRKMESAEFHRDAKYEDVSAAALDFDKDGDWDLYVGSGGNDDKELDKQLEDRIYLNDGQGNLKRLPLSLPHTNAGSISVGDFNNDGFDDIFVGARSIPGSYGLSPYSFVLKNKGGFGVEILRKDRYGMITDSEWADMDNDGDLDLVICGDWMSIAVLKNVGDSLVYQSQDIGLGESYGLWSDILLKDFNGDGQLDILVANAGLNFKWKASVEKPMHLYVADFDKNGQSEPIIFHHYFDRYKPFASFDRLSSVLPEIRKKFTSYRDFADVKSMADMYDMTEDQYMEHKQIFELRSMLYLSGEKGYEGTPLSTEAQMGTIQDFELNKNGDIFFVGNQKSYLTELGDNMSLSGGILKDFNVEKKSFDHIELLPLPPKLNTREIINIGTDKYLIICNDDVQYLLSL